MYEPTSKNYQQWSHLSETVEAKFEGILHEIPPPGRLKVEEHRPIRALSIWEIHAKIYGILAPNYFRQLESGASREAWNYVN